MIFLLALVALLAFAAGFLVGALVMGADHRRFNARAMGTTDPLARGVPSLGRRDEWPGS